MEEFLIRCIVSLDEDIQLEDNEGYTFDYIDIDLNKMPDEDDGRISDSTECDSIKSYIVHSSRCTCDACFDDEIYEQVKSLRLLLHPYKCNECGKEYSQKQQLKEHIKNFHTVDEVITTFQYHCPYCNYKSSTTIKLVSHLQTHAGRKGRKRHFRCSTFGCKYSCKTIDELKIHSRICRRRKRIITQ